MTEAEWLAGEDPAPMYRFLGDDASSRKLQLFAVACCRAIWSVLNDHSRPLVELVESYADGEVGFDPVQERKDTHKRDHWEHTAGPTQPDWAMYAVDFLAWIGNPQLHVAYYVSDTILRAPQQRELHSERFCHLIRDIFGNPFRPVALDPAWLTSDVLALARGIYDERAFDRMPILADALQDAGCDNGDILDHCRDPKATHVRGCWAVDLILDKS